MDEHSKDTGEVMLIHCITEIEQLNLKISDLKKTLGEISINSNLLLQQKKEYQNLFNKIVESSTIELSKETKKLTNKNGSKRTNTLIFINLLLSIFLLVYILYIYHA